MLRKIKKFLKRKFKGISFKEERGLTVLATIGIIAATAAVVTTLIGVLGLAGAPVLDKIASAMFGALMSVVNSIAAGFLEFAGNFFKISVYVGGKIDPKSFEESGSFQGVWGMFQSIAYMIIALGFVICGIATALRIQEYEAKKTLVPLILVAILISFSYGLFFDIWGIANEITGKFLDASTLTLNPALGIANVWAGFAGQTTVGFVMKGTMVIFMNFFTGSVYFLYGLIFLLRWAAIPILIIVSPLALACIPIGFLKHIWDKWLSQFTGWCLFGIIGAMCLYMANVFMANTPPEVTTAVGSDPMFAPFKYIMPLGALLFGLFFAGAGSLVGASAISSGIAAAGAGIMGVAAGGMEKISGAGAAGLRGKGAEAGKEAAAAGKRAEAGGAPGGVLMRPGGPIPLAPAPGAGAAARAEEKSAKTKEALFKGAATGLSVGGSIAKDVIENVGGAIKGGIGAVTGVSKLE